MKANIGKAWRGLAAASTLLAVPTVHESRPAALPRHSRIQESLCFFSEKFRDDSIGPRSEWRLDGESVPEPADVIRYTKTSFCYDQYSYINFHEPFLLRFDSGRVSIVGWDISFPCDGVSSFDKCLVRHLQCLFEKAFSHSLSEQEKKEWLTLLKHFDYRQFRLDYAPALYEELRIAGIDEKGKKVVLVRLDGKRNTCPITLSPGFSNGRFRKGDLIGAMVKRNHLDAIKGIAGERIVNEEGVSDNDWDRITVV